MFCRNCGKELADGAKFCAWCGIQVMREESEKAPEAAPVMPVQKKKNNGRLWVIGAAIVVVLLGIAFIGKEIVKLQEGQEDHGEKTAAGAKAKADRIDDTEEAVPEDAKVREKEEASGTKTKIEDLEGREAGLYQSDGSFVPWDDLGIDVETDYFFDNQKENSPFKVFGSVEPKYYGELVFPGNIKCIERAAFKDCESITSVDLSNTQITNIGGWAFNRCVSLTSIELPDTLTSIEQEAFSWCSSLTSIELPDTLTSLGNCAFAKTGLTSIELPDALTSMGDFVFLDSGFLTSVELPDTLTSIGEETFSGCYSLTSIELPDTLTSVEREAFSYCNSLTSIDLSNTQITNIGNWVFEGCYSLISIELPDTLTSMGDYVFSYCTSLININYVGTMEEWNEIDKSDEWNTHSSIETITCSDGVITL